MIEKAIVNHTDNIAEPQLEDIKSADRYARAFVNSLARQTYPEKFPEQKLARTNRQSKTFEKDYKHIYR